MLSEQEKAGLQKWLEQALADIMNHPSAWPFLKPVDAQEVSDYYLVIKDPIGMLSLPTFFFLAHIRYYSSYFANSVFVSQLST